MFNSRMNANVVLAITVAAILIGCKANQFELESKVVTAQGRNQTQFALSKVLTNSRTASAARAATGINCDPGPDVHQDLVTILNDFGCPQTLSAVNSSLAGRNAGNFVRVCHVPPDSVDEAHSTGVNSAAGFREELCVSLDALEVYASRIPALSDVLDVVGSCAPVCQCTNCSSDSISTDDKSVDEVDTPDSSPCGSSACAGESENEVESESSAKDETDSKAESKKNDESSSSQEKNESSEANNSEGGSTSSGCVPCGGYAY